MGRLEKNKESLKKEVFKNKKSTTDRYGRKVTPKNAEVDHKVPKSRGGNDSKANLEVISRKSNREKSDKMSGKINGKDFKVNRSSKNKNQGTVTVKK